MVILFAPSTDDSKKWIVAAPADAFFRYKGRLIVVVADENVVLTNPPAVTITSAFGIGIFRLLVPFDTVGTPDTYCSVPDVSDAVNM